MLIPHTATLWLRRRKGTEKEIVRSFRQRFPRLCEGRTNETILTLLSHIRALPTKDTLIKIRNRLFLIAKGHKHRVIGFYWWPVMDNTFFIVMFIRRREGQTVEVGFIWKPTRDKPLITGTANVGWHGGGHLTTWTDPRLKGRRLEFDAQSYSIAKNRFADWCKKRLRLPKAFGSSRIY